MSQNRVTLQDSTMDAMVKLAEGNPGAITALSQLVQRPMGVIEMLHLDDRQIYGSDIWVVYKDICNYDLDLFVEKITDRSNNLKQEIDKIQRRGVFHA